MKPEDLYISLNRDLARFAINSIRSKPFEAGIDEFETGSEAAASAAYIKNHLSDAQKSLATRKGRLAAVQQSRRS